MKVFTILLITMMIKFSYQQIEVQCLATSKCNEVISCSEHGHCFYDLNAIYKSKQNSTHFNETSFINCICDKGYTEDPNNKEVKCCYKKIDQFTPFILEVLIGFGIGHFYIGNSTIGLIKLVVEAFAICSCCLIGFCFCYKTNKHNEEASSKQKLINILFLSGIFIFITWQFVDMILFGINFYKDSNNVELESW